MQTARLIYRNSRLNHLGWQRRRADNLGIPTVFIKNTDLRLLLLY